MKTDPHEIGSDQSKKIEGGAGERSSHGNPKKPIYFLGKKRCGGRKEYESEETLWKLRQI